MSFNDLGENENERRIIGEFFDELRDTASQMHVLLGNLRSKSIGSAEGLDALKRYASNLRTQAHAIGMPVIKLVTHRLDEYVAEIKTLDLGELDEILVFVDKIEKLADGEAVAETELPNVMRALPAKRSADFDFGSIKQKNVEILLVVPEKAMARIMERELAACGYRTSVTRDPFMAIEMAVRIRPDMVIAAMELGVLTGVDLGCALAAMPATEGVPYAVLTSYEWGHPKLKGLPTRAAVVRKSGKFADDLAEALARFGIT